MSLPLINKQFMKQGLAITIATMKMNVTTAWYRSKCTLLQSEGKGRR